jgi:hypothetical protein
MMRPAVGHYKKARESWGFRVTRQLHRGERIVSGQAGKMGQANRRRWSFRVFRLCGFYSCERFFLPI